MTMVANRTQRRAQMRAQKAGQKQVLIPPVKLGYGHNGACVLIMFDKHTNALALSPEQADAMCASITGAKEALLKHKGGNGG